MKPIAITLGDPAGIGSEVVFKAVAELDPGIPLIFFGSREYASRAPGFDSKLLSGTRQLVDVPPEDSEPLRFGSIDPKYGRVSLSSIEAALQAIESGRCSALVTAPIHKGAIAAAGAEYPGHTELLAARAGLRRYAYDHAMYFDSPTLKVSLLSVHLPLRQAIEELDAEKLAALVALTRREFHRLYDRDPRMGVAAVNPHGGEGGLFGNEEKIILEGVNQARAAGAEVSGPHPPDTVFLSARRGQFDVVIAIYHDQGLIAVKTLNFERSVNVTIGLPYLRVSVDHGTAFDIAGSGVADAAPMRYAIEWAMRFAGKFGG